MALPRIKNRGKNVARLTAAALAAPIKTHRENIISCVI